MDDALEGQLRRAQRCEELGIKPPKEARPARRRRQPVPIEELPDKVLVALGRERGLW